MNKLLSELKLDKVKVLIVGDIMLDRYYYGSVSRISPEAPVPVINVKTENSTLGGACNVVNNVKGLSADCYLIGCAKEDESGILLGRMLNNIKAQYKFIDSGSSTISKLRVVGEKQQIVRLDFEDIKPLSEEVKNSITLEFSKKINEYDNIVISDYGKGVCSYDVCRYIIEETKKHNKYVIIDPKGNNWDKYKDAYIITPNVKELSEVYGSAVPNEDNAVIEAGRIIREKYNLTYLVVTRSERGITIIGKDGYTSTIPTVAKEVFDVSGAGDTVVASLAVFLGLGLDIEKTVSFANAAAGVVVGKFGTAPVTLSELSYSLLGIHGKKIISYKDITSVVEREKTFNKRIVFTNGCFDILHRGHISYLKKAKMLGDILIVGLNSDSSVKRLKGESRPVNKEQDRAVLLEALESIDYVVIFEEDTPLELIKMVKPDILVKGGDYKAEDVVGREYSKEVIIIDFVEGYSTTSTIEKIGKNGGI